MVILLYIILYLFIGGIFIGVTQSYIPEGDKGGWGCVGLLFWPVLTLFLLGFGIGGAINKLFK